MNENQTPQQVAEEIARSILSNRNGQQNGGHPHSEKPKHARKKKEPTPHIPVLPDVHVNGSTPDDENGEISSLLHLADQKVKGLPRDVVKTAASYDREQALGLVGLYDSIQKVRMGARNRESAHERRTDICSDPVLITAIKKELEKVEAQVERGLLSFASAQPLGRWAMKNVGVGHICTAAFLAHIDLQRCCCPNWIHLKGDDRKQIPPHECPGLPTLGRILKFAGCLPKEELIWEKGMRRPYNLRLKVQWYRMGSCWKRACVGKERLSLVTDEDFRHYILKQIQEGKRKTVKEENMPKAIAAARKKIITDMEAMKSEGGLYVRLYQERKAQEVERNNAGMFRLKAKSLLEECLSRRANISPEQKACWESGKLQDVGLDRRAIRHAVKIFLSHWHTVGRYLLGLPEVVPYVMAHGGHVKYIHPPFFDVVKRGEI